MWLDLSRGQILKDAQSIKKLRSIFWSKLLQKNCLAGPFFTDADVIQVNLLTDFFLNHAKIGAKNSIQHPIIRTKLYFFLETKICTIYKYILFWILVEKMKNNFLLKKVSGSFLEVEWYFFLIFKSKEKQKSCPCYKRFTFSDWLNSNMFGFEYLGIFLRGSSSGVRFLNGNSMLEKFKVQFWQGIFWQVCSGGLKCFIFKK